MTYWTLCKVHSWYKLCKIYLPLCGIGEIKLVGWMRGYIFLFLSSNGMLYVDLLLEKTCSQKTKMAW